MTQEKIKPSNDQLKAEAFLSRFGKNPGHEDKVPFKMETEYVRMYSVDTIFDENGGITRFQGVVLPKFEGKIYLKKLEMDGIAVPPLVVLSLASGYDCGTYYPAINSVCYNIWFKKPLTEGAWNNAVTEEYKD